jgi:hypothetical protein
VNHLLEGDQLLDVVDGADFVVAELEHLERGLEDGQVAELAALYFVVVEFQLQKTSQQMNPYLP